MCGTPPTVTKLKYGNPDKMSERVVDNILDLIGGTPIIKLNNVVPEGSADVWAKLENLNPAGSVKERICLKMIAAAEE